MENFNEKINEQEKPMAGCFQRFSKTIKMFVIGGLILLLTIPMFMIDTLIKERASTQENAIDEVSQKWSLSQTITGPYFSIPYPVVIGNNDNQTVTTENLLLFPDELIVDGELTTQTLKRSIYEVNVYQSDLTIKGSFSSEELRKDKRDINILELDKATVCMNLSDMRGICEQVHITLGDSVYTFEPGINDRGIDNTGIHVLVDLSSLKQDQKIPYEMKIKLKGSQSLFFIPLGKTTQVNLHANWNTPSFTGNYLPDKRDITDNDFSATWQVLNLNRNYSQVMTNFSKAGIENIEDSYFGVNLKIPVEQYQQSMRTTKYSILIVLLTFAITFFTEIANKTRIHALQYLLIGLALCLFYSLLLSFSEHIGFNPAYLLSATLTILLIGGYMFGIIRKKKPVLILSGLLCVLYAYIFILIQLETYALLAGSLGLFITLALVMFFSKKIDWFNE